MWYRDTNKFRPNIVCVNLSVSLCEQVFLNGEKVENGLKVKGIMMDETAIKRTLARIAHEIVEKNNDLSNVILIGIKTRGITLADRIAQLIYSFEGVSLQFGTLDISGFRDDLVPIMAPMIPQFDFSVVDKDIILVDDVLFTGRTVRAGIEAIIKSGRPNSIQLAVLIDRGHRELPIRADYVGKNMPTSHNESVKVLLEENDGEEKVVLLDKKN